MPRKGQTLRRLKGALVVTCEHGGNRVPTPWRGLFAGREALLASHRGWDAGALDLARAFAARFKAPLHYSTISRLLVDLNRSPESRTLFSEVIAPLDACEKERILGRHYRPWRRAVLQDIETALARADFVLHLSVHSFVPTLGGVERTADVGLLFDPRRRQEREFCLQWRAGLREAMPTLRVRSNYPYRGTADGHTTSLRRRFRGGGYLGIELEVNQRFWSSDPPDWRNLKRALTGSFFQAAADWGV